MRRFLYSCIALAAVASVAGGQERPAGEADGDPQRGFLPKGALGVASYQVANPTHDGRGVLVAVIDTGLDLLHPGLQRTADGKRKIVDYYDATDAGDVDTSLEQRAEGDTLIGLSGRVLTLGERRSDDGRYRLGVVRSARQFPGRLHRRLVRQRKDARADLARRTVEPKPKSLTEEQRARRADRTSADSHDPGPVFDLLLFRSGDGWWVVIDTDEDGDLGEETPVRPFAATGDVVAWPSTVHLGLGIDVRDGGDRTVLLFDGGGHGTHVAGIIGAYYRDGDPLNGLAPGCRFLAVKCGNTRLGGPTSHNSIMKGIDWACRRGAHVINISFGGDSFFRDGREVTARFVNEAVAKYSVPIILSAGNSGPALSTIGSPSTAIQAWSIGAWAPAPTQEASYGVAHPLQGRLFDFSSRGPLNTGGWGVDFIAPGAAVSTLPTWHLQRQENWNGTSMAAPQATGAVAVVQSAAMQRALPASEARLRRAFEISARPAPGLPRVEQGHGLLQVGPAVAVLAAMAEQAEPPLIRVALRAGGPEGGIYERDFRGTAPTRFDVHLQPLLPDHLERNGNAVRAAWSQTLRLEADQPWVRVGRVLDLTSNGAWLPVTVDPAGLAAGLNTATVTARDLAGLPVARIPVTIVRAAAPDDGGRFVTTWSFSAGDRRSSFVRVPAGATRVQLRCTEMSPRRNRYTVALHALSGWSGIAPGSRKRAWLTPGNGWEWTSPVEGGTTLEIAAASRWQESGNGMVKVEVQFLGVRTPDAVITVPRDRTAAHWRLVSDLRDVTAKVSAVITQRCRALPLRWTVERDPLQPEVLGGETMYQAIGRGELYSPDGKALTVDLQFDPQFADFLDDAHWEAFDRNGRAVAHGHLWSGTIEFDPPHAGTFDVRLHFTERGRSRLDRGGIVSALVCYTIPSKRVTVHADLYGERPGSGKAPRTFALSRRRSRALFLRLPTLAAGWRYRGRCTLTDERTGSVLLKTPLEVDRLPAPRSAAQLDTARATLVRTSIERLLDGTSLDGAGLARLTELLAAAKEAGLPEARIERWYVDLTLAGGDVSVESLSGLREILTAGSQFAGGPMSSKQRRALVWNHLRRSHVLRLMGDLDAAWQALHAARYLDPTPDGEQRVELALLVAERRWDEAVPLLRELLGDRPDDIVLARLQIDCYRRLGWVDRVAEELATWTDRFPRTGSEVMTLAQQTVAAPRADRPRAGEPEGPQGGD